MTSTPEVSTEVVLADGTGETRGRWTVLRLTWTPADPMAVTVQITARPDHPSLPRGTWVVLRDFLRYGMETPTGDGEVRIRPDELRDRVWLELARPGRAACVSMERSVLDAFLTETERHVAVGEERSEEALDALLSRLLGD